MRVPDQRALREGVVDDAELRVSASSHVLALSRGAPSHGRASVPLVPDAGEAERRIRSGERPTTIRSMSIQDQYSALRAVAVRPPEADALRRWREYGWRAAPRSGASGRRARGVPRATGRRGRRRVRGSRAAAGDPDAIYVYDPVLMSDAGAILLRPAKEGRRGEATVAATDLEATGVRPRRAGVRRGRRPLLARPADAARGRGLPHDHGRAGRLRALLPDVRVVAFDLPHLAGPAACTHLSFLSILDEDLVVASLPHLPVRLVELLRARHRDRRGTGRGVRLDGSQRPALGPRSRSRSRAIRERAVGWRPRE